MREVLVVGFGVFTSEPDGARRRRWGRLRRSQGQWQARSEDGAVRSAWCPSAEAAARELVAVMSEEKSRVS
jgi:hypothetical protein